MSAPLSTALPSLLEKLFALRGVQPFDRLTPDELTLVAEVARPRTYAPGEIIHLGEAPLSRLLVVTEGTARDLAGRSTGAIAGVASMLNDTIVPELRADAATGARILSISKHHFFTLARECPEFVLGLIELGAEGAPAAS